MLDRHIAGVPCASQKPRENTSSASATDDEGRDNRSISQYLGFSKKSWYERESEYFVLSKSPKSERKMNDPPLLPTYWLGHTLVVIELPPCSGHARMRGCKDEIAKIAAHSFSCGFSEPS